MPLPSTSGEEEFDPRRNLSIHPLHLSAAQQEEQEHCQLHCRLQPKCNRSRGETGNSSADEGYSADDGTHNTGIDDGTHGTVTDVAATGGSECTIMSAGIPATVTDGTTRDASTSDVNLNDGHFTNGQVTQFLSTAGSTTSTYTGRQPARSSGFSTLSTSFTDYYSLDTPRSASVTLRRIPTTETHDMWALESVLSMNN